mgnify:CR=1 FL=1
MERKHQSWQTNHRRIPGRERESNGNKDFVEQVKEQIQDFLPEKFADATVSVHQVVKNNDCVLDGLTIRTEESNISPTVYLNSYFTDTGWS